MVLISVKLEDLEDAKRVCDKLNIKLRRKLRR